MFLKVRVQGNVELSHLLIVNQIARWRGIRKALWDWGVAILVQNAMFVGILCGFMSEFVIIVVSNFARMCRKHVCT